MIYFLTEDKNMTYPVSEGAWWSLLSPFAGIRLELITAIEKWALLFFYLVNRSSHVLGKPRKYWVTAVGQV